MTQEHDKNHFFYISDSRLNCNSLYYILTRSIWSGGLNDNIHVFPENDLKNSNLI